MNNLQNTPTKTNEKINYKEGKDEWHHNHLERDWYKWLAESQARSNENYNLKGEKNNE